MDDLKRNIDGWRHGRTCPCCREVADKAVSRRLARRRLRQADRRDLARGEREELSESRSDS